MKLNRRDFLLASSSACLLTQAVRPSSAQTRRSSAAPKTFSAEGRKVFVYTTAEKTDYRLSATGTLTFKHLGQPLETQVCVSKGDRKSTRLNSSHANISYAVFCLKKKKKIKVTTQIAKETKIESDLNIQGSHYT